MWVGLMQLVEDLKQKGWVRRNSSCLTAWVGTSVLLAFGWELKPCSTWISRLLAPRLAFKPAALLFLRPSDSNWNHIIGSPGSPAGRLQILGLLRLHNCVSQFLIIYVYTHKHTHTHTHPPTSCWFCFSREPWLIHKPSLFCGLCFIPGFP